MKRLFRTLALAASLLSGLTATAAEPATRPLSADHRLSLESFPSAHVRAYMDGTPEAILHDHADTVRLMPGYQKTVIGKPDVAAYHAAFLKRFAVSAYVLRPM